MDARTAPVSHHNTQATEPIPLVLTIEQAARRLGIGRTLMYELVTTGQIESVTIGRLRRIPADCLTEYINRLRQQNTPLTPAA
jgi:excisionase family DNA binding protein